MDMLVPLFVVTVLLEALAWAAGQPWALRALWAGNDRQARLLKRELASAQAQLHATSAVNNFAKWARLQRTVTDLEKRVSSLEAATERMVSKIAIPLAARVAESTVIAALLFAYGGTDVAPLPRGLASLAGILGFGFGHGYVSGFVWITLSWLGARLVTASLSPAAL